MKTKVLILLFTTLFITTSCSYFKEKNIEVKNERLSITQKTSFDVDKAQMGKQVMEASIHGEITNVGDKILSNIVITYKFPRDWAIAKIKLLKPGQTRKFTTTRYETTSTNPSYKLDNVAFDKK
jgi:uncharacterized membrane protein